MALERGEGVHGHVDALEGLDAAHEEEHVPVGGQTQGAPRLGPVPGGEESVVDAGSHDVHTGGIGVVELGDLISFDVAGSEHRVRASDHVRLRVGAVGRLVGSQLLRARLGLDPRQRVEGGRQGHVELVLDDVARQA